jgi:putative nucleotidyltransferase with HDIG domain
MLNGRILIVTDRAHVVAELEPIIRGGQHLPLAVSDGAEALRIMEDGVVPDVVVSDLASTAALEDVAYLWRFRELNRVGRRMVVVEEHGPTAGIYTGIYGASADEVTPLRRPFRPDEVRQSISGAVRDMDRDLVALRGEMWRELHRMQCTIRDVQAETVNALAATIAARDPYMHGHSTRVAALAVRTALELGVEPLDRDLLQTACRLHEIGKIAVPVELLHKTDPLRPDELEQIRGHARVGAEIVRAVPSLRFAASLIEHQGSDVGTLAAVFGEGSTPYLLAAILRVADVYDAMSSARSYRGPMPPDYCENTLRRDAGSRYHAAVVTALLRQVSPLSGRPHEARAA